MKSFAIAGILVIAAAAPCLGQTMILGNATGTPGQSVSVTLSVEPEDYVTSIKCTFEYDTDLLWLDSVSRTLDAEQNGFIRIWYWIDSTGRVHLESDFSQLSGDLKKISDVATLTFIISSSAPITTTQLLFFGIPHYEVNGSGGMIGALPQNGAINIEKTLPTPTPFPVPSAPDVRLRMESSEILTYGEEPVLEYDISMNDFGGTRTDAYVGVTLPDGRFYWVSSRGELSDKRSPTVKNFVVVNRGGFLGFFPLPESAPEGIYTFFGTLAHPGTNPLNSADRLSNLESARFELKKNLSSPAP